MLLNQATSSLDADTERRIMQTFEHLFADRTIIIIAHRLSRFVVCLTRLPLFIALFNTVLLIATRLSLWKTAKLRRVARMQS
jgi:ABC-type uncharacterized transport system fused permease/ATPase subunit